MRFILTCILLLLTLTACVSSETSTTTQNTGTGKKMTFDPKGAAETRIKIALLYLQEDQMQQAKENLDKALKYQPDNANVYRIFAYYYQRVNENAKAEQYYKKALDIDDTNSDTYNNYGTFLCKQKRYKEAETEFLNAIKQSAYTGVANTYENAGVCEEEARNVDKAIYYYEYAISHNPRKAYLNLRLAKLYITKKDYKAARVKLFNYQKKTKSSAESLWVWIRLSYATEKTASLNKYAGKLLEKFPDSQRALDYLNHEYYK